jgi:CubicO group peptidase (beta-lactamase class C family)
VRRNDLPKNTGRPGYSRTVRRTSYVPHARPRRRVSWLARALVITGLALLVLITTCSPPQPRALIAPAGALQAADDIRPLEPRIAGGAQSDVLAATPQPTVTPVLPTATAAPLSAVLAQSPDELRSALNGYLNEIATAGWFQGAVLVAYNGHVILSQGYGMADAARNIPNTPQTRFRLASVTKQFTSMAIMILQARGKLDVHESVCSYLPDCPEAWRPISVQNLLTHTSGLPNYTDFGTYEETQMLPATPEELLSRFRDQPLLFEPGTQYMYENSDYVLLGVIIEHVSGQRYADFMRAAIFDPLGMRDSGVDQNTGAIANGAQGYLSSGEPAPFLDASTLFSAGSLYSTVEDMYRWDQALYTTALVPQPLLDEIWTPHLNEYGYGWMISNLNGHREISHPGLIDGFATAIARFPDDRVTIIVLSNMSSADASGISNYLAGLVFGG